MAIRWMSVRDYAKKTGISEHNVRLMIKNDEITAVTTEGGGKYLIKYEDDSDVLALKELIIEVKELLQASNRHFGVNP
jgi:excisionase family DNA binding protein